jgi:hypothetical protein
MRVARLISRAVAGPWRAICSRMSMVREADLTEPVTAETCLDVGTDFTCV